MFKGCSKLVSMVFQGCFKEVLRVFQGCLKDVSRVFDIVDIVQIGLELNTTTGLHTTHYHLITQTFFLNKDFPN